MSRARSKARQCAMQALYQWQMTGQDLARIEAQFMDDPVVKDIEMTYFKTLLHEVPKNVNTLDQHLSAYIDRSIAKLDLVERAILRLSAYELVYRLDIPYRVVINEGVELAKSFGGEKGHRYVNGVLDKLAHNVREVEIRQKKKK